MIALAPLDSRPPLRRENVPMALMVLRLIGRTAMYGPTVSWSV